MDGFDGFRWRVNHFPFPVIDKRRFENGRVFAFDYYSTSTSLVSSGADELPPLGSGGDLFWGCAHRSCSLSTDGTDVCMCVSVRYRKGVCFFVYVFMCDVT